MKLAAHRRIPSRDLNLKKCRARSLLDLGLGNVPLVLDASGKACQVFSFGYTRTRFSDDTN